MATESSASSASAPIVAICGWLLPGLGYALIGQTWRAITIGATIIVLFIAGLLIAGARVVEVPGFNVDTGDKVMTTLVTPRLDPNGRPVFAGGVELMQPVADPATGLPMKSWSMVMSPLSEIRDKPWSVPQALAGPIAIAAGWWSIHNAAADGMTMLRDSRGNLDASTGTHPLGAVSHARSNEIGSLYLSVAGLLNLMAIIDSAWRASHINQPINLSPREAA